MTKRETHKKIKLKLNTMDKRMEQCYEFLMREFQLVNGRYVLEAMEYANWEDNFQNHNLDRGIPPFYVKSTIETYHQKFMRDCTNYLEHKRFKLTLGEFIPDKKSTETSDFSKKVYKKR